MKNLESAYNFDKESKVALLLILCSKMKILWVESRDFSQAEKDITTCKAKQIHKMTSIFTQNDILGPKWKVLKMEYNQSGMWLKWNLYIVDAENCSVKLCAKLLVYLSF